MNQTYLEKLVKEYSENALNNKISKEIALSDGFVGMKIYEEPILGFARADNPIFEEFKHPNVIGKHFLLPKEWLPEGKTVISIFFPLSEQIRKSNSINMKWPSLEWLHGKKDGQDFIFSVCKFLVDRLKGEGHNAIAPVLSPVFSKKSPITKDENKQEYYTSNWSERHVAYACGLGTFGLSKGIITEKGVAGRFASIIVDYEIEPTIRNYKEIYEYCTMCGACINHCPVGAISFEKGKEHKLCSQFLDKVRENHEPRDGCGKCQVRVPCEDRIPNKSKHGICEVIDAN